jgi:hypothetical protein
MSATSIVYWHRELPPCDAEPMGEHVVEATRARVASMLAHRDELWDRSRHDDVAGESWLHGTFTHMLYRRPTNY